MNNRTLLYLLLVFGECLVVAAFFLFLRNVQEENLFYLNLVAAMALLALNSSVVTESDRSAEMTSGYAGLGLRWLAVWLLTGCSVVLIVCSVIFELPFHLCLWGQLLLVFGAAILIVWAKIAADNAAEVLDRVDEERSGLKMLAAQLTLMEAAATGSAIAPVARETVAKLQEEVNCLTVSLTPVARTLESELLDRMRAMTASLRDPAIDAEAFRKAAAECTEILKIRRKQYYK